MKSNTDMEAARIKREAGELTEEEIRALVKALASKDDSIRYPALLLLKERSLQADDVYAYWDVFREKLRSPNAFQRSIGLAMCARNARWDTKHKLDGMLDEYLACLEDEKPMVVRLCVQNLEWIVPCKKELCGKIAGKLMEIKIGALKKTQRKLVLQDILHILKRIKDICPDPSIDAYFATQEAARPDRKPVK